MECPYKNIPLKKDGEPFTKTGSIVREIWGKSDTILFIFAGSAAEFALNKAVDWLYFTGKLPSDPLGRLFSTVSYAREIVFAEQAAAERSIRAIAHIHTGVEFNRGRKIPAWAYRDVLFMLIDYSIRAYEILERRLTYEEKAEVFDVFNRVGKGMQLEGLPETFSEWELMRLDHLEKNLAQSEYTKDLFIQYKKHLGSIRFFILRETQKMICPTIVRHHLNFKGFQLMRPVVAGYKLSRILKFDFILKALILPSDYKEDIKTLDIANA